MLPNPKIQRRFLISALTDMFLLIPIFSSVYLEVASLSYLLVIIVSVCSAVWIVSKVREIDRRDLQTLYGQSPQDSGR